MTVTDLRDVRVMIPMTRRAIDGPTAESSGSVSATLSDNQVKDVIADAVADVILYTGGVFGKALEVTERDETYMAPTEYQTSEELTLMEQRVIAFQAALTYYFHVFKEQKVSERISNEGAEWEWSLSASVVRDHMQQLRDARDRALEALKEEGAPLDAYESFLAVRDTETALVVEPWTDGAVGTSGDTRIGFGLF